MNDRVFDYRDLLHREGLRVTPQRQLILDAVRGFHGHVSPEKIFRQVHRQAPTIHRATVYRTLDLLCDLRLVVATRIQRHAYYEIAGKVAHHHLVCRRCNRVFALDHRIVQGWFSQIREERHFLVDMDHLTLSGLCPACQALGCHGLAQRRRT